ncbi:MAG: SDR family NAD(P)-dependent oxidoreductase [Isosphaeraceae bacterium]
MGGDTNLLGLIRVAMAFLPQLRKSPEATLINVSSGLDFVPMARFPVPCASKAAVHSSTMSLRHQLKGTGVKVIELIPPYITTELGKESNTNVPVRHSPMPPDAFLSETMKALEGDADEVAIGDARNLDAAAGGDSVRRAFIGMNR